MPIERVDPASATALPDGERLAPGAERVVTAQIYGVLARSPQWRFVSDLTVSDALHRLDSGGTLVSRAIALGREVDADAVLFGTVSRYVERVGAQFGARQPAAVSFTLQLVSVRSETVVWQGSFDQSQQSLTANLFNWWQFWRGGPRWFTASEFTRLGVEHLLEDLSSRM